MERQLSMDEDREIRRLLGLLGEQATPVDLIGELNIWDPKAYIRGLRSRLNVRL